MKILFCLLFSCFVGTWASQVRYDNFKIYRLTPKTNEDLELLQRIERLNLDVWKHSVGKNDHTDIMVPPHKHDEFYEMIKTSSIHSKLVQDNLQNLIEKSNTNRTKRSSLVEYGWDDYYTPTQINLWLYKMALRYPTHTKIITGGRSYQGRPIKGIKLSFKKGNKIVFVEGGIHAREWIAPATITFIINEFLTSKDPSVREVAESYDWYFFPSVNPDGFEYTHTTARLWRTTRQPHGLCIGADANRNFAYHWNEGGTSNTSCEEKYPGPYPFSEPEAKSLSEYITSLKANLIAYLAVHSYSQVLLIPYGYSTAHVDNYDELMEIGTKAIQSLEKRHGTKFRVGNWLEELYISSGVSVDWVKGTLKTPITYTIELRDTGEHGFLLPPEQIIPTAEETLDCIVTMMLEAKTRGYK